MRPITAISNTLAVRHPSSTIALTNISIMKNYLWKKNISIFIHSRRPFVYSTLGKRDFFSRVMRSFVGRRPTRLRPSAENTSGEAATKNPALAQSTLIYRARWTLTLSLICQSYRRSQDCEANLKVITKEGTTCSSPKSHIIFTKTSWSLKIIA